MTAALPVARRARPVALLLLALGLAVASCGRWGGPADGNRPPDRCAALVVENNSPDAVAVYHVQQAAAVARVPSLARRRVRLCGLQGAPVAFRVRAFAGRWERTVRPGMHPIDAGDAYVMTIDGTQVWIRPALQAR